MKKIIYAALLLSFIVGNRISSAQENINNMQIIIKDNQHQIIYQLNNSAAAKDLYRQLPLSIKVENYGTNEKIFYPPQKINTSNTPIAYAEKGTLAYYAPWENIVMFYKHYGQGHNLYELGNALSGQDDIEKLSGTIKISIVE